jgi:hypothetical protein
MRLEGARITRKLLSCGLLCLAGTLLSGAARAERLSPVVSAPAAADWASGAFRRFRAPEPLLAGRVQLSDEADDESLRAAVGTELKRLRVELHERQGWADPLPDAEPLRVFIARADAQGVARLSVRSVDRHRLLGAAIQIDATGLTLREVVHTVARLYARATLEGYGAPDGTFLSDAAAEALSGGDGDEERIERLRIAAAATTLELGRDTDSLGRAYIEEFTRAAGPGALRGVWERAAQSGENVLPLFLRAWTEAAGEREDLLLLRAAARLYATVESWAGPTRLTLADLQSGLLDAGTPATYSVRHRSFLPGADATGALRISWPDRGAPAAAVVRYRDAALPPDVVFWAPGSAHTIPLSGVSRVDWVVSGTSADPPLDEVTASVDAISAFPFGALTPQAVSGANGTRISWTTSGHAGLAGWALFREEVQADGKILRTGPHILPSTHEADESFRYAYVDPDTSAGTYYRYSVWAVTDDGLLARAFSATLRTSD